MPITGSLKGEKREAIGERLPGAKDTWWGEAPERPCDLSKEVREHLKEIVGRVCKRAEPRPSDRPRLGALIGITTLLGSCNRELRNPGGSCGSRAVIFPYGGR